jgi:transcriptional regulator with XRE-family HTH domain
MVEKKKTLLKEFASRVKEVREALKGSQEEMAARFGVGRSSYIKYEYGNSFPALPTLILVSRSLDISLDWLIAGKGPMFYQEKEREQGEATEVQADGLTGLEEEVQALLHHMATIPLLRHEVLRFYYKFLLDYPDLFPPDTDPPQNPE